MSDAFQVSSVLPPEWWTAHLAAAAPDMGQGREDTVPLRWPPELAARLMRLARDSSAPPALVIVTGLLALLARYSQGATLALQWCDPDGEPGGAGQLRIKPADSETFAALLARVRAELAAPGHLPSGDRDGTGGAALRVAFGAGHTAATDADIFLQVSGSEPALRYRGDRFDRGTVERMADHLAALLATAVAAPGQPLAELPAVTRAELTAAMTTFGRGADIRTPATTIPAEFTRQAARTPGAVAVECGEVRLTYGSLAAQSRLLAGRLLEAGIRPGAVCAVLLPRSIQRVVSLLAVLRAGGAYLPLDAGHPPARLAAILRDAGVMVAIAEESTRDLLPAGTAVILPGSRPVKPAAMPAIRPADLAYIMYTSGSTGTPKGVMVEHRCVTGFLAGMRQRVELGPGVRMLQFAGITFDSTICEIFGPLLHGGTVVIPPAGVDLAGPGLLDFLRTAGVTTALLPPSLLAVLPDDHLPALRTLVVGGEIVPSQVFGRWGDRRFLVAYGPTETTLIACTGDRLLTDRPPPLGRPLPGVEIYVLDDDMRAVAPGVPGEIWIGGANLARGYLGSAALTADRFRPHPYAHRPGARLYRTGDLGRWLPDGDLEFLGRADGQIKIRGHRVELAEVEAALHTLPGVRAGAVIPHGTGPGLRLVAFISGEGRDTTVMLARLAQLLPPAMVPAAIISLPRLPTASHGGKVDRARLAELAARHLAASGTRWPSDRRERRVARVWAEVLGTSPVSRDDDFTRLGGTSLQAAAVLTRLREAGLQLSLAEFFAARTVAGVAALLAPAGSAPRASRPAAAPVRRTTAPPTPSLGQRRIWFLSQLNDQAAAAYLVPVATRLRGPLDVSALRAALDAAGADPAFQSGFAWRDGDLTLGPPMSRPVPLELVDVSGDPDPEPAAMRAATARAAIPLDPGSPPLLRAHLIRLADTDHLLLVVIPHLVCDAWSVDVLDRRIAAAYAVTRHGLTAQPPATPLSFGDFAAWERKTTGTAYLKAARRFWRRHLRGIPPALGLPADRARTGQPSYRGQRISATLPAPVWRKLASLARAEGTTPYVVCLTALAALLRLVTGRGDVVIGSPMAGRPARGLSEVVGFFVNTIPVRLQVSGKASLRQQLPRCAAAAYRAIEHQYVPFDWLVKEFGGEAGAPGHRLVEVALAYQGPRRPNARLAGLECQPVPIDNGTAKFDLTIEIEEIPDGLACTLEFSTDRFTVPSASRLLEWYLRLLRTAVSRPDTPLDELGLFRAGELALLPPVTAYPAARALHELFSDQAARQGSRTAIVDGDRRLSYAELDRAATRRAGALRRRGVGPGVLAGVWAERTADTLITLLAVLKAGGAYLPLDPCHPPARLAGILTDAGCRLLVGPAQAARAAPEGVRVLTPDLLVARPAEGTGPSAGPEDLAYVIYTSGSTGAPKGVMVTHRNAARLFAATVPEFGLGPGDVWTLFHSFAFDFSVWEMWGALLTGGTLVVVPHAVSRDPAAVARLITRHRVTVLSQTPSAFRGLLQVMRGSGFPATPPRLIVFGGERLDPAVLRPWFRHYGEHAGRLVNMYGITEATVHVTARTITGSDDTLTVSPIGRPLPDLGLYLLDERLRPVPAGGMAEMYVAGPGVARGYLGRPDLTAARFLPDPFGSPGARMYRTGDLAILTTEGELLFCGRSDDQLQLRGFRIEPGEVQAVLIDQSAVRDAAVLVRPDRHGSEQLVGYVVPARGEIDEAALRAALAERLPDYMVPARIVAVTHLPVTANGKLDADALPAPAPRVARPASAAPRPGAEAALARVWAEVLEVAAIGRDDNFFRLGGDSIIAIQIIARCREAGLMISVEDLYRGPTVAGLAQLCGQAMAASHGTEAPAGHPAARACATGDPIEDRYPAAAMQAGIIYECELSGDPTLYHDLTSVTVSGPLEPAALARALDSLTSRHEVLRTAFDLDAYPEIQQVLHRRARIPLQIEPPGAGPDPRAAVRAWWERQWRHPFDLSVAPLARCHVLPHPGGRYDIALSLHHSIADGWSFSVLVGDLLLAYDAELSGGTADATPTGVCFRDFIALERAARSSEAARRFWLAHAPAGRSPRWRQAAAGAGPAPDPEFRATLPPALVTGARAVADRLGVPVKSVMLAAHLWALGVLGGESHVITGISANGRPEVAGAEWAAGVYLNCVPLAVHLNERDWAGLIGAAFNAERALIPHRRYPLAQIQADSGRPPFEALFNFADFHSFDRLTRLRTLRAHSWWFSDRTGFPLDVELGRRPLSAAVDLSVRVNPALVPPAVAARVARLFQSALAAIVRDPRARPSPAGDGDIPVESR